MRIADLDAILASDLPCTERMVLIAIASHINQGSNHAWPSMARIGQLSGIRAETACRSVARLKRLGWLVAKRRFSKSTEYEIVPRPCVSIDAESILTESQLSIDAKSRSVLTQSQSNHPGEPSKEPSMEKDAPPAGDGASKLGLFVRWRTKDPEQTKANRDELDALVSRFGFKPVFEASERLSFASHGKVWPNEILPALLALQPPEPVAPPVEDDIRIPRKRTL